MAGRTLRKWCCRLRQPAIAWAALALATALEGCALYAPPPPWDKGVLARPDMQFDADVLDGRLDRHVYASKESATGGYGVGGGGCGCN